MVNVHDRREAFHVVILLKIAWPPLQVCPARDFVHGRLEVLEWRAVAPKISIIEFAYVNEVMVDIPSITTC